MNTSEETVLRMHTVEEAVAVFVESLEATIERQVQCMAMARAVLHAFVTAPAQNLGGHLRAVDMEPIIEIFSSHLGRELTHEETIEVGSLITKEISTLGGLSACLVWYLGHEFEHLFYGNYVPKAFRN